MAAVGFSRKFPSISITAPPDTVRVIFLFTKERSSAVILAVEVQPMRQTMTKWAMISFQKFMCLRQS